MRIPDCFQKITEICVPTERFTAGNRIRGQMKVPFRELQEGREKNSPEALMLVTAAVLCAGLPGIPVDILPALSEMGFRTGTIRRTTKTEFVCEGRISEVRISDSRIASYLCGDSAVVDRASYAWQNGQLRSLSEEDIAPFRSQKGTHYAACDREGHIVYLGVISVESGAEPCVEALEQLSRLQEQGIRVVLSRRPGRMEYHPGLQVICAGEKVPMVEESTFADWVTARNRLVTRNRFLAALAAGVILIVFGLICILK